MVARLAAAVPQECVQLLSEAPLSLATKPEKQCTRGGAVPSIGSALSPPELIFALSCARISSCRPKIRCISLVSSASIFEGPSGSGIDVEAWLPYSCATHLTAKGRPTPPTPSMHSESCN